MALTFDTGKHARAIREGGVPEPAADAIVDAIAEATDSLVTQEFLRNELALQTERLRNELALQSERMDAKIERLRAEMWRALYMSVGIMAAIAGIALAIAELF